MEISMITLQYISYLSEIGLFVVSIIGLKQLTLTREIAKINAKRESVKLANDQISFYLTKIIDLQNALNVEIERNNISIYKKTHFTIKNNGVSIKVDTNEYEIRKEIEKLDKIISYRLDVLNSMEIFASFFTSKVADEEIAFKAVGRTYCNTVEELMFDIARHVPEGYHQDILDLFLIWNSRMQKRKLFIEKEGIESELNKIKSNVIKPLGTE